MGDKLNAISLFSGIGGFELGLHDYCRTMLYCEADKHAQAVLLSRMSEGAIDNAPICTDVREITAEFVDIPIDIISGGFPCQDVSVAGKGAGLEGERSGLFFEIVRLAEEIKPAFLFLENVSAIRTRGLDRVIEELTEIGYDCRWCMLSASDVGAKHKRERWFLLAYSESNGSQGLWASGEQEPGLSNGEKIFGCNSEDCGNKRAIESNVGGMADGVPFDVVESRPYYLNASYWQEEPEGVPRVTEEKEQRVERIKRLGNAVVPLQVKTAFEYLLGITEADPTMTAIEIIGHNKNTQRIEYDSAFE